MVEIRKKRARKKNWNVKRHYRHTRAGTRVVIEHHTRRRITPKQRAADRDNALKGTANWKATPARVREGKRMRPSHGWGFEGSSPKTKPRTYKTKRNRGEPKKSKITHLIIVQDQK
jgi:hypothetical protein